MNDLEMVRTLLDRAGVVFDQVDENQENCGPDGTAHTIRVTQGQGPRNLGYSMFVSDFYFDGEGNLLAMGAWE